LRNWCDTKREPEGKRPEVEERRGDSTYYFQMLARGERKNFERVWDEAAGGGPQGPRNEERKGRSQQDC